MRPKENEVAPYEKISHLLKLSSIQKLLDVGIGTSSTLMSVFYEHFSGIWILESTKE